MSYSCKTFIFYRCNPKFLTCARCLTKFASKQSWARILASSVASWVPCCPVDSVVFLCLKRNSEEPVCSTASNTCEQIHIFSAIQNTFSARSQNWMIAWLTASLSTWPILVVSQPNFLLLSAVNSSQIAKAVARYGENPTGSGRFVHRYWRGISVTAAKF